MRKITEDYTPSGKVNWLHNRHRWDFHFDSAPNSFPALSGDDENRNKWIEGCIMNGLIYVFIGAGIVALLMVGYCAACCCCKPRRASGSPEDMDWLLVGERRKVYNKTRIIILVLLSFGFFVVAASTFAPVRSFDTAFNHGLDAIETTQDLFKRVDTLLGRTANFLDGPIQTTAKVNKEMDEKHGAVKDLLGALKTAQQGTRNSQDSVQDLVENTGNVVDDGRHASDTYGKPIAYTYATLMCLSVIVLLSTMIPWRICSCAYKSIGVPSNLLFLLVLWIGTGLILIIGLIFADYCTAPNGNIWKSVEASSLKSESSNSIYYYLSCNPDNPNQNLTEKDGVVYTLNQTKQTLKTNVIDKFNNVNQDVQDSSINKETKENFNNSKREIDKSFSILSEAFSLVNCTNVRKPWGQVIVSPNRLVVYRMCPQRLCSTVNLHVSCLNRMQYVEISSVAVSLFYSEFSQLWACGLPSFWCLAGLSAFNTQGKQPRILPPSNTHPQWKAIELPSSG
eukprot:gb/GECG01015367.1/.p1 GENE.gb/GECG01015367.1/~~gb/GECG01015367.1/.p1  ORF type:complete len:508 (+),score=33.05 gb/GECG01015367.1/:1-1524(+)